MSFPVRSRTGDSSPTDVGPPSRTRSTLSPRSEATARASVGLGLPLELALGAATGSPVLAQALAWVECRVQSATPSGDHIVFIAEVVEAELVDAARRRLHRRLLDVDSEAPLGRRARHVDALRPGWTLLWNVEPASPPRKKDQCKLVFFVAFFFCFTLAENLAYTTTIIT